MSWQKCPICDGVGIVSGGYFTRAGDYNSWVASNTTETCRICEGSGILDEVTGLPPARKAELKEKIRLLESG